MIDLHTHILPGVDDGAADLDEAVKMCHLATESGCTDLVATPHQHHEWWWNSEIDELETLLAQLQERCGPEPRLHLGGEIRVAEGFVATLDHLMETGVLSLAGSSYLLLEFDRHGLGPDPKTVIHETLAAGWRPVIAHPEFVPAIVQDMSTATHFVELGAHLQVTAMSVTGHFGQPLKQLVDRLFDAGLVDFVASDTHGIEWRRPGLKEAHDEVGRRWGEEAAQRVTTDNPAAVLENRPLGEPPSEHPQPRALEPSGDRTG